MDLRELRTSSVAYQPVLVDRLGDDVYQAIRNTPASPLPSLTPRAGRRWAAAWPTDKQFYLVPGFGTGQHVRCLLERIDPSAVVVVLERRFDLLRATLDAGAEDVLSAPNLYLLTSEKPSHVYSRLAPVADMLCRRACVCSPILGGDLEWWQSVSETVLDLADSRRTGIITQVANSHVTCLNLLDNLPAYLACPGIDMLADNFAGLPAIIVGAGPSLDKQLALLQQSQGRYVLIACLTVLKPLLMHNIWPHYVTALDYCNLSARFVEELPHCLSRIHFVYEPKVSAPVVRQTLERGGLVSLLNHGWLNEILLDEVPTVAKTPLASGSTVAHLSFNLAQFLGCDPIIMIGQDLAFTLDGRGKPRYYPECVYAAHPWKECQRQLADPEKSLLWPVKDADGKLIPTNDQMKCYLAEFEVLWSASRARVVDATEGGAAKEGIHERLALAETLDKYCQTALRDYPLGSRLFDYRQHLNPWNLPPPEKVLRALQKRRDTVQQMRTMFEQDIRLINLVREKNWEAAFLEETKEIITRHRDLLRTAIFFRAKHMLDHFSGVAPLAKTLGQFDLALLKPQGLDRRDREAEVDLAYISNLHRAGEEFLPAIEQVIAELGRDGIQSPATEYGGHCPG